MSCSSSSKQEILCCRCFCMIDAVNAGHTKCLKHFLKTTLENPGGLYTDYTKPGNTDKTTLLHIACEKGFGDCARILLKDSRVRPNRVNERNKTALHTLCEMEFHRYDLSKIILLLLNTPTVSTLIREYLWSSDEYTKMPSADFLTCFYVYMYTRRSTFFEVNKTIFHRFLDIGDDVDVVFRLVCNHIYDQIDYGEDLVKMMLDSCKVSDETLMDVIGKVKEQQRGTGGIEKLIKIIGPTPEEQLLFWIQDYFENRIDMKEPE